MTTFASRGSSFSSHGFGNISGANAWDFGSSRSGTVMSQRSRSVYGGESGSGTRMSSAASSFSSGGGFSSGGWGFGSGGGGFSSGGFSSSAGSGGGDSMAVSEKATMQNLNTRLAMYLEKVANLEQANAKLELQIKEWGLKHIKVDSKDLSSHQVAIEAVRTEFLAASMVVTGLALQVDNTKLTADDFRTKFETEMSMRQSVEADIAGLKRILGELTLTKKDLDMQLVDLNEEKVYLKQNHGEETASFRAQLSGQVKVELDAAQGPDLNAVISEIREQYEVIVAKSRREAEAWFNTKAEAVQQEASSSVEVVQTISGEIKSSQSTLRSLEQELQSTLSMKASLEGNLAEMEARYGSLLGSLQLSVTSLESQLTQIRGDTERSSQEYQALLDIKTRLEMEIAEYRRLLEGGDTGLGVTKTGDAHSKLSSEGGSSSSVKVVTVIEDMVDGKLVSSSSTTSSIS